MQNGSVSENNTAGENAHGGGVFVDADGSFTMLNGSISDNRAAGDGVSGGGVYVSSGGEFTMEGGTVAGNRLLNVGNIEGGNGGGIFMGVNTRFTMRGEASVLENTAAASGGGVWIDNDSVFTMHNGAITRNQAQGNGPDGNWAGGGGVFARNNVIFTMEQGAISNNIASRRPAGGIYLGHFSEFTMNNGIISGNTASGGGGVWIDTGSFKMNNGSVSENNATGDNAHGGGVFVGGEFEMVGGTISGNISSGNYRGGGVSVSSEQLIPVDGNPERTATFTMRGGIIENNMAVYGGGVSVGRSNAYPNNFFYMHDGIITGNLANSSSGGGGGVDVNRGLFRMYGGVISRNHGTQGGGVCFDNNMHLSQSTFTKTGGWIYGSDHPDANIVNYDLWSGEIGPAVHIRWARNRITTAGPDVNLDSSINENWE
jgi:hypothetical protein